MRKDKFSKRKQIRLKYYDYSTEGMYFITICTKDRKQILSKIIQNENQNEKPVGAGLVSARNKIIQYRKNN